METCIAVSASEIVAGIERLQSEIPNIDLRRRGYGPRRDGEFDPNLYFLALPLLSLSAGYMLDYVYNYCGMAGAPWIYARKIDEPQLVCIPDIFDPELNPDQVIVNFRSTRRRFQARFSPARFIEVDDSAEGWFQILAFMKLAGQFYLYWHSQYNDFRFLTSPQSIEETLRKMQVGKDVQRQIRQCDTRVEVVCMDDCVQLTYCGFSAWNGVSRYRSIIDRIPPYSELCEPEELVRIPYHCGILF
jgi:hypothetical protein